MNFHHLHCRYGPITILLLATAIESCHRSAPEPDPFKIDVISSDYSMAYAIQTTLTDSAVQVRFVGGLVHERPRILWERKLLVAERDTLHAFLNQHSLDTLARVYDVGIPDGMQYGFRIEYQGKTKQVQLGNMWLPQLRRLVELTNSILPDSLRYSFWVATFPAAP
jgi:hypothetical protein